MPEVVGGAGLRGPAGAATQPRVREPKYPARAVPRKGGQRRGPDTSAQTAARGMTVSVMRRSSHTHDRDGRATSGPYGLAPPNDNAGAAAPAHGPLPTSSRYRAIMARMSATLRADCSGVSAPGMFIIVGSDGAT